MIIEIPEHIQLLKNNVNAIRQEYDRIMAALSVASDAYSKEYGKWILEKFLTTTDKLAVLFAPHASDDATGMDYWTASSDWFSTEYGSHAYLMGINAETRVRVINMAFRHGDVACTNLIRKMIEDTLPYITPYGSVTPTSNDKIIGKAMLDDAIIGRCLYNITEHSLSKNASYSALISPVDKTIVICKVTYGRREYSKPMEFEEGIAFIHDKLYYDYPTDQLSE